MIIKTKLHDGAPLPAFAYENDLGADVTAVSRKFHSPFKVEYDTGIALASSQGAFIYPRSSVHKTYCTLANSPGVIDPEYRGTIKLIFYIHPMAWLPRIWKEDGWWRFKRNRLYEIGDRIGQLIIIKTTSTQYNQTENLPYGKRSTNGFGSTGRNTKLQG
jgi:dUTPase